MAITKSIIIDGKEVQFRASAAVPRMYRIRFRRDIFRDLLALQADIKASEETREKEDAGENSTAESSIVLDHLEIFENIAYVMAKHADPSVPNTPDEWLDGFSTFSIYEVLPELLDLWAANMETQVQSKKDLARLTGK